MEDLQSLMACLDDISSKIPDGIYLDMADKMKRVHDHMNGNKPFFALNNQNIGLKVSKN